MLAKTGKGVLLDPGKTFLYNKSWKAARESLCSNTAIKKTDYSLQLHMGGMILNCGDGPVIWWDWNQIVWSWRSLLCLEGNKRGEACRPKSTISIVKYGSGSIMLRVCFAAGKTGVLHKTDSNVRNEDYVDILRNISKHQPINPDLLTWSSEGVMIIYFRFLTLCLLDKTSTSIEYHLFFYQTIRKTAIMI